MVLISCMPLSQVCVQLDLSCCSPPLWPPGHLNIWPPGYLTTWIPDHLHSSHPWLTGVMDAWPPAWNWKSDHLTIWPGPAHLALRPPDNSVWTFPICGRLSLSPSFQKYWEWNTRGTNFAIWSDKMAILPSRMRCSSREVNDGQFSERCEVDGSFFNSDAIPIIFGKAKHRHRRDYFFLPWGPIIFQLFCSF